MNDTEKIKQHVVSRLLACSIPEEVRLLVEAYRAICETESGMELHTIEVERLKFDQAKKNK